MILNISYAFQYELKHHKQLWPNFCRLHKPERTKKKWHADWNKDAIIQNILEMKIDCSSLT